MVGGPPLISFQGTVRWRIQEKWVQIPRAILDAQPSCHAACDLRKAGEVTSDAMQLLQRGILTADAELRKTNTAGRLLALQDVRLTPPTASAPTRP